VVQGVTDGDSWNAGPHNSHVGQSCFRLAKPHSTSLLDVPHKNSIRLQFPGQLEAVAGSIIGTESCMQSCDAQRYLNRGRISP
jgi:hypothetical protein